MLILGMIFDFANDAMVAFLMNKIDYACVSKKSRKRRSFFLKVHAIKVSFVTEIQFRVLTIHSRIHDFHPSFNEDPPFGMSGIGP